MSGEFNTEVASIMIRQALEDLEATENKEYFEIDMANWVTIRERWPEQEYLNTTLGPVDKKVTRVCKVCFAGSVMSNRLQDDIKEMTPKDFDDRTRECLHSLDRLRVYDYQSFLTLFYGRGSDLIIKTHEKIETLGLVEISYDSDPQQFKENMNKIADKLEELGL